VQQRGGDTVTTSYDCRFVILLQNSVNSSRVILILLEMPVVCSLKGAGCPELRCIMKEDQWFNSETCRTLH
jgi:hypothetical protein